MLQVAFDDKGESLVLVEWNKRPKGVTRVVKLFRLGVDPIKAVLGVIIGVPTNAKDRVVED